MDATGQGIEVPHRVKGISPVNGMTASIQHEQTVKHLEEVRARLVQHSKHQLSSVRQFFEDVEDLLAVPARQPTCGLVQEEHRGLPKQFETDVDALPLSTRNDFVKDRPHAQILNVPQAQLREHFVHTLVAVFFAHGSQAELGIEGQVFAHGQFRDEHIFLRHMADPTGHLFPFLVDV